MALHPFGLLLVGKKYNAIPAWTPLKFGVE
jgi:hypothetical protein